jgi:succinoglycan biosynthesis protein ExoM
MSPATPDISICVCTFRRPHMLERLLQAITKQERGQLTLELIIVDNDPHASAQPVVSLWQEKIPFALQYHHVPKPNIASARNQAVHAALGDWILCIDDDEIPDDHWIILMHAAQQRYQADAVFGPVLPMYQSDTPNWIMHGKFFERQRFATGTTIPLQETRTGNVLIRRAALMQIAGPFNERFGKTGAEDTVLFHTLHKLHATFVWCDEATVKEEVPAERARLSWLLRRSYRMGQTFILSSMATTTGAHRFFYISYLAMRAILQCGIAALMTIITLLFSPVTSVRWLRTTVAQCGKLSALLGHRYHEYGQ